MGLSKVVSNVGLALDKVSAADIATLKRMGNRKMEDNPIRVHQAKDDALIISVGAFAVDDQPAGPRFGLSAEIVGIMKHAADNGAFYLELTKDGPSVPTSKPHADLSTGHLRQADYHLLEDIAFHQIPAPVSVYDHGYGWIVDAKSAGSAEELKAVGLSDEFVALVAAAREVDVDIIDFDSDADLDPGYPEYDSVTDERIDEVLAPSM